MKIHQFAGTITAIVAVGFTYLAIMVNTEATLLLLIPVVLTGVGILLLCSSEVKVRHACITVMAFLGSLGILVGVCMFFASLAFGDALSYWLVGLGILLPSIIMYNAACKLAEKI